MPTGRRASGQRSSNKGRANRTSQAGVEDPEDHHPEAAAALVKSGDWSPTASEWASPSASTATSRAHAPELRGTEMMADPQGTRAVLSRLLEGKVTFEPDLDARTYLIRATLTPGRRTCPRPPAR
jgi:hypothetical protein